MIYLYIYRITSDTGLAPCVDNGLLSLACCKGGQIRNGKAIHTGLRYRIGSMCDGANHKKDNIYLLGTHKNKLLYLARITNIVTMTEYFSTMSKGRIDSIYSLTDMKLVRNHHLWNEYIIPDSLVCNLSAASSRHRISLSGISIHSRRSLSRICQQFSR